MRVWKYAVVRRAYVLLLQVKARRSCSCETSRYLRDGYRERSLQRVACGVSVWSVSTKDSSLLTFSS